MIARDDRHLHAHRAQSRDRVGGFGLHPIGDGDQSHGHVSRQTANGVRPSRRAPSPSVRRAEARRCGPRGSRPHRALPGPGSGLDRCTRRRAPRSLDPAPIEHRQRDRMFRARFRGGRHRHHLVGPSPATGTTSVRRIAPSVTVPVLSSSTTSAPRDSNTSPPLNSTPSSAARPVPAMIATGVASPSAHGQAMSSTATACSTASPGAPRRTRATRRRARPRGRARRERTPPRHGPQLLHGRLRALRLFERSHDPGERVLAPTVVTNTTSLPLPLIVRPPRHRRAPPRPAPTPPSTTRGPPTTTRLDDPVGRDVLAGAHHHEVARTHLVDRHLALDAVIEQRGLLGTAFEQHAGGVAGARAGRASRPCPPGSGSR